MNPYRLPAVRPDYNEPPPVRRWRLHRGLPFLGLALLALPECAAQEQQTITQTVENASAVAQYKILLGECRKKGREAHSFDVYEACANDLDADLCRRRSVRCPDGGAP